VLSFYGEHAGVGEVVEGRVCFDRLQLPGRQLDRSVIPDLLPV
jgi:hypothetical protein